MLIEYDWQASEGEAPGTGTWLNVSGDPDRPVLRGAVARLRDAEGGITVISILMADGQNGTHEFHEYLLSGGDVGIEIATDQSGPILLG